MSAHPKDASELTPIKRALYEIRNLRARVAALEEAAAEPIAVIGSGCRMPGGVHDEASLWDVLDKGIDTIRQVPGDRWNSGAYYDVDPDRPGTISTNAGGFLDGVAGFDAAFFGIAPREAISMDPQQRLMLEIAWEALEDAAIAPDSLVGTETGVFVGVGNNDYGRMLMSSTERIDGYAGSGGSLSVIAGRLSYVLGLQGPAMAVDTACSASLVAVHLACQSLRRSECELALAGGINLILSPDAHIAFTKARMLAKDGRCKTFDAAADGYGRGEGGGVIVLRRLKDAKARGDRILAVIRGSAINQDGRSGGLTAPNGPAQVKVIRAALADGGLRPEQIDYVEAHGTGTELGDPIELQALAAALGEGRTAEQALLVGSCKTNFGHLEAAAGIAGLLKVVAALRRRRIPPHLHLHTPNPLVDWANMTLRVPTACEIWPKSAEPARAGVSSFGFSGTNAHIVLEEAPPIPAPPPPVIERPVHLLTLSARDDMALMELGQRYRLLLAEAPAVADVCFTANTGRAHLARRASVRGGSTVELDAGLAALLAGAPHPAVSRGTADGKVPAVAFLFTGQGAQYRGMAQGLYHTSPVFRHSIDRCAEALGGAFDLVDLLYGKDESGRINDTVNAQPALFAVEVALAELWRSWGVDPAMLIGHSLGEYAAACVAGVISVEDALRLLVTRGQLTQALPGDGAMASVMATREVVEAGLINFNGQISIAAYNGPRHMVVSGVRHAVEAMIERLSGEGVQCRLLRVSHGFHSPLIEPALAPFGEALAGVRFAPARDPLISNLTGRLAEPGDFANADYWLRQMRAPVRFEDCIREALAQGITHFIEIGPHPVLLGMAADCVGADNAPEWLPSLRRDTPDWTNLLGSLQNLYAAGAKIMWSGFDQGYVRRRIAAPTMPFQHRRYWIEWSTPDRNTGGAYPHAWERISAALARHSQQAPIGVNLSDYAAKWKCLEQLTAAYAARVLRDAGLFVAPGDRVTVDQVLTRLGAADTYRHLLKRWLQLLAASGRLRRDGDIYVADRPMEGLDVPGCLADARRMLADNPALLAYIERCGEMLHAVLAGRESPLETLFPNGTFEMAEGLYERSAPMRYSNSLAAGALEAFITARPPGAPLRVLEIGAGTGGTATSLIPVCPVASTTYWFTDITSAFFGRAREKYAECPFVRFATFDLDRDPNTQGFNERSFDLIVAANAVHATRDLRASLRAIRSLLAPGGMLLLIESTEHLAWFDITTGLIEGWQHFVDDLRDDNPLLSCSSWTAALREAGFDQVGAWPPEQSVAAEICQSVIVARIEEDVAYGTSDMPPAQMPEQSVAVSQFLLTPSLVLERLSDALPEEQMVLLREFVRERVMHILGLDPADAPERNDRLMDLGLDSLMAVQLRNSLGTGFGFDRPLPATLMFDHPSIEALARFLRERLVAGVPPSAARKLPQLLDAGKLAAMSESEAEVILLSRLEGR